MTNHTRRSLLKTTAGAALSMPFLSLRAAAETRQLTMLAWYGHAEPDIVGAFEEANNVKFVPKYYTGGDNMLGLISQSPPGTYDIILSDAEYVQSLNAAGYVEKLDPEDYHFDDYFPEFQHFPGNWKNGELFSVITRFGFLGISYNTEVLSEKDVASYGIFWDDRLKEKLGQFDWHLPNLGQMSLYVGNPAPYDIDAAAWEKVQDVTMSLRPQVGGFFDYGGTFSSLKNGQMTAFSGIGDWITGVLEKNGAPVRTAIPEEGGLQWSECFSIGKDTQNHDLAKKWIQYITSPEGQAKSADMAAYPALVPSKKGWEVLQSTNPAEAERQGMVPGAGNAMDMIRSGKIQFRQWPIQQSLEDWNDFWSDYKGA